MIERVLIADDEPLARERVFALVRDVAPRATIRSVGDGHAALQEITDWQPQVVLLDIQMPGRDGFEVVAAVGADQMPLTVFVTAYDQHAMRAFNASAVDYLLKPFDDERFTAAWRRVARLHAASVLTSEATQLTALLSAVRVGEGHASTGRDRTADEGDAPNASRATSGAAANGTAPAPRSTYLERFMVRRGERTLLVSAADVRWLRSDGNYVELHTAQQGVQLVRETLSNIEERLDPSRFVRIHRRVIVAIDYIRELQPWFAGDQILILKDGSKLRVSRTRREAVSRRLVGPD